jgi:hypothetical protein
MHLAGNRGGPTGYRMKECFPKLLQIYRISGIQFIDAGFVLNQGIREKILFQNRFEMKRR